MKKIFQVIAMELISSYPYQEQVILENVDNPNAPQSITIVADLNEYILGEYVDVIIHFKRGNKGVRDMEFIEYDK